MIEIRLGSQIPTTWRYALIGGLVSIPLTVGSHWLSGTESYFSLNMVFLGGLLAGYLASTSTAVDTTTVGLGTGVIGGLPGLWVIVDLLGVTTALGGPIWFRILGTAMAVVFFTTVLFGFAALVGVVGAWVGDWLATKLDRDPSVSVEA